VCMYAHSDAVLWKIAKFKVFEFESYFYETSPFWYFQHVKSVDEPGFVFYSSLEYDILSITVAVLSAVAKNQSTTKLWSYVEKDGVVSRKSKLCLLLDFKKRYTPRPKKKTVASLKPRHLQSKVKCLTR